MAVSGSFDHSMTRTSLIEAALRKLGVLAEGQSASSNQLTYGAEALNNMLKAWGADLAVWYENLLYVYPNNDVTVMTVGPSGTAKCSLELGLTKLTAAAASSATALTVSVTSAIDVQGTTADSDVIGIELDSGNMHWTTISSGGGTASLVIASGLASAASSGNRVYFYTALPQRPVRIIDAWIVNAVGQTRRDLQIEAVNQIRNHGSMTTEGSPVAYAWLPKLTNGELTIWPEFPNGEEYLELRVQYPFDDMDSASDTLAFDSIWFEAVVYNLALRLADEYTVPDNVWQRVQMAAEKSYERASGGTTEGAGIQIFPAPSW